MPRPFLNISALTFLSLALLLNPARAAETPAIPAHPAAAFEVLSLEDMAPERLLPPPPERGSVQDGLDLAAVEKIYHERTAERGQKAAWDDQHEDISLFSDTLGADFRLTANPKTAALIALVQHEQSVAATLAKRRFKRMRPWGEDPEIHPCDYKPNANPYTSYPSGHATVGYALATLLGTLLPDRAEQLQARAADYAYSRMVCGDHFPSDLEASHALGIIVTMKVLQTPTGRDMLRDALAEIASAKRN